MTEKFKFLDHTADAKFQAFGGTLEEAFSNAALAVASLMWDPAGVESRLTHAVNAQGRDLEQLLVSFLGEIVYLLETKGFILARAAETKIVKIPQGFRLTAVFEGDDRPERYPLSGHVKAITYNEMKIEIGKTTMVQAVVDI
jgi:SHS2 domain-containing protein